MISPFIISAVQACWQALKAQPNGSGHMLEIPPKALAQIPDISIDYAVMERSSHVAVVPSDLGWSDIGSWNVVKELVNIDRLQDNYGRV